MLDHPLDNAAWSALVSRQSSISVGNKHARRFPADICPLAGCVDGSTGAVGALLDLIPEGGDVSIMQRTPLAAPEGVAVKFRGDGVQMVATNLGSAAPNDHMAELGEADAQEMFDLAALTRPGPFVARTHRMGRFIGIRDAGSLVAMAGERLQMDGYSEVSAVCTHPDYRGRGYGAALLAAVGARMLSEGITPFLHAYASNTGAIALYRSMGFEHRCSVVHEIWERAAASDVE